MKFPERTFKPARRDKTGPEARIVLTSGVLLVFAPEHSRNAPAGGSIRKNDHLFKDIAIALIHYCSPKALRRAKAVQPA
jgi:hypothetical protein